MSAEVVLAARNLKRHYEVSSSPFRQAATVKAATVALAWTGIRHNHIGGVGRHAGSKDRSSVGCGSPHLLRAEYAKHARIQWALPLE